MSLQRFLDWFEGFSENIGEAPSAAQWDRICQKISALQPGENVIEFPSNEELRRDSSAYTISREEPASIPEQIRPSTAKLSSQKAAVLQSMMRNYPHADPNLMELVAEENVTETDIDRDPEDIARDLGIHLN